MNKFIRKMTFDKAKFLKLLKERQTLKNKGILFENFNKDNELFSYIFMIDDQIFWESRYE